ncbi:hypothetical protein KUTeg_024665 [Tegillarca granosa]|uniref:Rab-GAP TBC domain-containing protein n=1 Tax=Tegillarca granosa TaxID=220873 RepID=A0ABQ9DYI4_TEGGR|nr:hypothetical protein KUTeg_024665 [Tegillarca granosa]
MGESNISQSYMQALMQELRSSKLYSDLLLAAQSEISKTNLRLADVKKGVQTGFVNSGWDKKLKNAIYKFMLTHHKIPYPQPPSDHVKEPLQYLRKAQQAWEKRILKSLNSMCTELNIPLARKVNLSQIRPVYAPKDFLDVIIGIQNPNYHNGDSQGFYSMWGIVQVPLKVKGINKLRLQYSEMSINQCQSGIDDSGELSGDTFENERVKLGRKVLAANHGPLSQEFAKKGCPMSQRASIWSQILSIELDEVDQLYYEQLKVSVQHHDLLVDSLLYKDVKLTATNDDQYFVFEDFLYQVLLPFSRDTMVLKHFAQNSATPPKSYIRGKLGVEEFAVIYPPNGVIPFHGFAMYVAPLCYLYNEPIKLYYVFREMYMRYFFRLHSISSHPQVILAVAIFSFRKTNLLKVQSYNAAEAVLADLTTLQVIPLIQLSLFSK